MNLTGYLKKQFGNLNSAYHYYVDDLTEEEWLMRPGPDQNRIGYTVWHLPRTQDHFLNTWIRGATEIAYTERWSHWEYLKPMGAGIGITLAEADEIARSVRHADVLAYADEVHQAFLAWLTEVDEDVFDQVPQAEERLAMFPAYQRPRYLKETHDFPGLPVWGLLIRPCMAHIHRHLGDVEITKDVLRKAKQLSYAET